MSSIDIDRLASQFDRSMTIKGKTPINATPNTFNVVKKNFSGEKKRHARQYFKNQMRENRLQNEEQKMKEMLKRPKEEKVRYDTHRIAFTANSADEELNDLHYANFLGDKYGDNKAPYNSVMPVNVKFCDAMREERDDDEQSCDSLARKGRELAAEPDEPSGYDHVFEDGCPNCGGIECICDKRCQCEGCCYNRETAGRSVWPDEADCAPPLCSDDIDVCENLEWVEALVKRQHASYLEAMKAVEDEENAIEWEDEDFSRNTQIVDVVSE